MALVEWNVQLAQLEAVIGRVEKVRAVRKTKNGENTLYAEYQRGSLYEADIHFDQVDFVEYYDLDADEVMLRNLAKTTPKDLKLLSEKVQAWYRCSGKTCP